MPRPIGYAISRVVETRSGLRTRYYRRRGLMISWSQKSKHGFLFDTPEWAAKVNDDLGLKGTVTPIYGKESARPRDEEDCC